MSLSQIKAMKSERGFTIVELLIVVVIIGILAAIVIVAYNGITQRANASAAKSNATSVRKVAEAFNAECPTGTVCTTSGYPTLANLTSYSSASGSSAKLPAGLTVTGTTVLSATHADGKTIIYKEKGTTGACIGYWDDSLTTPGVVWVYLGDATTGGNANPATCA